MKTTTQTRLDANLMEGHVETVITYNGSVTKEEKRLIAYEKDQYFDLVRRLINFGLMIFVMVFCTKDLASQVVEEMTMSQIDPNGVLSPLQRTAAMQAFLDGAAHIDTPTNIIKKFIFDLPSNESKFTWIIDPILIEEKMGITIQINENVTVSPEVEDVDPHFSELYTTAVDLFAEVRPTGQFYDELLMDDVLNNDKCRELMDIVYNSGIEFFINPDIDSAELVIYHYSNLDTIDPNEYHDIVFSTEADVKLFSPQMINDLNSDFLDSIITEEEAIQLFSDYFAQLVAMNMTLDPDDDQYQEVTNLYGDSLLICQPNSIPYECDCTAGNSPCGRYLLFQNYVAGHYKPEWMVDTIIGGGPYIASEYISEEEAKMLLGKLDDELLFYDPIDSIWIKNGEGDAGPTSTNCLNIIFEWKVERNQKILNPNLLWTRTNFDAAVTPPSGVCRAFLRSLLDIEPCHADSTWWYYNDYGNIAYNYWDEWAIEDDDMLAYYDAGIDYIVDEIINTGYFSNLPSYEEDISCISEAEDQCEALKNCEFCAGVTECGYVLIKGINSRNIIIQGEDALTSIINMQSKNVNTINSDVCEGRMAIDFDNVDNVVITNIHFQDLTGGGVGLSGRFENSGSSACQRDPCENVEVSNCMFDNIQWAGLTMTCIKGCIVQNCAFVGATGITAAGIAVEPNHTKFRTNCPYDLDWYRDVEINGCYFNNNNGFHLYVHTRNADTYHNWIDSVSAEFHIKNCFFDGPGGYGLHFECDNVVPSIYPFELEMERPYKGRFNIENCLFRVGQHPRIGGNGIHWALGIDGGNGYKSDSLKYFFATRYKIDNCLFINDNLGAGAFNPIFTLRPLLTKNSELIHPENWNRLGGVEFNNTSVINRHTWPANLLDIRHSPDDFLVRTEMRGNIGVFDKDFKELSEDVLSHPCWYGNAPDNPNGCDTLQLPTAYGFPEIPSYTYKLPMACYDNQLYNDFPYIFNSENTLVWSDLPDDMNKNCLGSDSTTYLNNPTNTFTLQLSKLDSLPNGQLESIKDSIIANFNLINIENYMDSPKEYCDEAQVENWENRILIKENTTWSVLDPATYEENRLGHVIVYPGATLTILSKTAFPPNAAIVLLPGSHLNVYKASLMNSCSEKRWGGIISFYDGLWNPIFMNEILRASDILELRNEMIADYSGYLNNFKTIELEYATIWSAIAGIYATNDRLECKYSNFNNNRSSVWVNGSFPTGEFGGRSFNDCNFNTRIVGFNEVYAETIHESGVVTLFFDNYNTTFNDCDFIGNNQYECDKNMGIIAINSNYEVFSSSFTKCNKAINALNLFPTLQYSTIANCKFKENLQDISLHAVTGMTTIKNNRFTSHYKISDPTTWEGVTEIVNGDEINWPDYSTLMQELSDDGHLIYAIVAEGNCNFDIEGNSIVGYDEGIYTINTGEEYNVIKNNEFVDCRGGVTAAGNNKYLSYYCNYFDGAAYDMSVIKMTAISGDIEFGTINIEQHRPLGQGVLFEPTNATPEDPASNMFDLDCDANAIMHLYGEEDYFVPFTYYAALVPNYSNLIPVCNTDGILVTILSDVNEVNPNCSPEDVYILPNQMGLPTDQDIEAYIDIKDELLEKLLTFDSGDPDYLMNLINTAPNHSYTQSQLSLASPYLSKDILWAIASHPTMTNSRKLARLLQNSPLDPGLLEDMSPYLSLYMSNMLWSSVNTGNISAAKALAVEINSAERLERELSSDVTEKYMVNDSVILAMEFLETSDKYIDQSIAVGIAIRSLTETEYTTRIASLPDSDQEKIDTKVILNVEAYITKYGSEFEFWEGLEEELALIATRSSPASYYAKNLLKQYKNYCYSPSLPERPEPSGKTGRLLYNPDIQDEALAYLLIAPNPATDVIHISAIGDKENYKITIYDLLGRSIYSTKLIAGLQTTINTSSFMNGTYIVELSDNSGFKHSEKLIITR